MDEGSLLDSLCIRYNVKGAPVFIVIPEKHEAKTRVVRTNKVHPVNCLNDLTLENSH